MFKLAAILAIAFLAIDSPVQADEIEKEMWWPFYGKDNYMRNEHLVDTYKAIEKATENLPSTDKYKRLIGRRGSSFWSTMLTLLSCVPSQEWPHSRVAVGGDPTHPRIYAEKIIVDRSEVGIELDPPTAEKPWFVKLSLDKDDNYAAGARKRWPLAFAEAAFTGEAVFNAGWAPVADDDYYNDDPTKLLEFFTGENEFTHENLTNTDETWNLFKASDKRPTNILLDGEGWFALMGTSEGDTREYQISRFPSDGDELPVTGPFDDLLEVGPLWKLVTLGEDFKEWDSTNETTWYKD